MCPYDYLFEILTAESAALIGCCNFCFIQTEQVRVTNLWHDELVGEILLIMWTFYLQNDLFPNT